MRRNQKGFTLMELMVVIVIVAILAAVAVPLYINYVKDATRTEAKGAIGAVITAEQTNFQVKGVYVSTTFVPNPQPGDQNGLNCDLTEALINWTITVAATGDLGDPSSAFSYTVTATGKAGKSSDGLTVTYEYKRDGTGAGFNP